MAGKDGGEVVNVQAFQEQNNVGPLLPLWCCKWGLQSDSVAEYGNLQHCAQGSGRRV